MLRFTYESIFQSLVVSLKSSFNICVGNKATVIRVRVNHFLDEHLDGYYGIKVEQGHENDVVTTRKLSDVQMSQRNSSFLIQ